jgi:hypothetical protein
MREKLPEGSQPQWVAPESKDDRSSLIQSIAAIVGGFGPPPRLMAGVMD